MRDKLITYLSLTDTEAFHAVRKDLNALGYKVVTDGINYVFGIPPGEYITPVLLTAHVDTLCSEKTPPKLRVIDNVTVVNDAGVLGGDDRAGVVAILQVASNLTYKPYILFTNFEESGLLGAREFVKDKVLEPYTKNIYLFIGADRRGHCDYVTYGITIPHELAKLMRELGYTKAHGSTSDVKVLTQEYQIAHVNVSTGYYCEHSEKEVVQLDSLAACARRMEQLALSVKRQYMAEILPPSRGYSGWDYSSYMPKPSLPKPSDNAGQGTAVLPSKSSAYLPLPQCELCKRDDRGPQYRHEIDGFLCHVCKKKIIDMYGSVSLENLAKANVLMNEERARTRAANRALHQRHLPAKKIPRCPVCRSNADVEFRRDEVGFVCAKCQAKVILGAKYSGVFYVDNDRRVWVSDGQVYRSSLTEDKLVSVTKLEKDPLVRVCRPCGKTGTAILRAITHVDTGEVMHLCKDCRDEAVNLGFLSDNTPPW